MQQRHTQIELFLAMLVVAVSGTLGCSRSSTPQGASGGIYALPQGRATAWNPGLTSKGGIPSANWPVYTTIIAPATTATDASAAINSALAAAPDDSVVLLGPGNFGLQNYIAINRSNVVLRGSGAGVTHLYLTNGATWGSYNPPVSQPVVLIGPNRWPWLDNATSQLIMADAAMGSFTVTVPTPSSFAVGSFVVIDEVTGAAWQRDLQGWSTSVLATPDYLATWKRHSPGVSNDDPISVPANLGNGFSPSPSNGYASIGDGSDAAGWFSRPDRPQGEVKEISGISGNTITFSTPLHKAFRTSHYAQLTRWDYPLVTNSGVENMTMAQGADFSVQFSAAAYCWAKNVEMTESLGGVAFVLSFRNELRDSYIHHGAWPEPGGAGYAVALDQSSADILVENNIIFFWNKMVVARAGGAGSVYAYNYADDGMDAASAPNWIECGINGSHFTGAYQILFEGNYSYNWDSDETHGNATSHTVFRNWFTTYRRAFEVPPWIGSAQAGETIDDASQYLSNGPYRAIGAQAYSYNHNFVGNVLGVQNVTTPWAHAYVYASNGVNAMGTPSMWLLGWDDEFETNPVTGASHNQSYDNGAVEATTIRDGNWDWVSSHQCWHGMGCTGYGGSPQASGCGCQTTPPVNSILPPSLYLTIKPSFFGSNPWPWVDPTTGRTYTLPAKARFDANTPNLVP